MNSSKVLFDTSTYITYKTILFSKGAPGWHSAVVWQERLVGAGDAKMLRRMETECREYEQQKRLLVPDTEAWLTAGRILYTHLNDLSRKSKSRQKPHLDHPFKQNLIRDVLIAVSAKKSSVMVVSDNLDFQIIQRYYKFQWITGRKFFGLE